MEKTSAEIGNDLDQVEKELDKEEQALLRFQEQYSTYGRDITVSQLKRKDLEIPIKKVSIKNLG